MSSDYLTNLRARRAEARRAAQDEVDPMMSSRIERADIVAALAMRQGVPRELLEHFSNVFGKNVNNGVLALQSLINNVQTATLFLPNFRVVENLRKLDNGRLKTMLRQESNNYKQIDPFSIANQAFGNALVKWLGLNSDGTLILAKYLGADYQFPVGDFSTFYSKVSALIKSSEVYLSKVEYKCLPDDDEVFSLTLTIMFNFHLVAQDDGSLLFQRRPAVEVPPAVDEDTYLIIEDLTSMVTPWWAETAPRIFNHEMVEEGNDYSFVYAFLLNQKSRNLIPLQILDAIREAAAYSRVATYTVVPDSVLNEFADRAATSETTDADFIKLKATQDSADKWLRTGNIKNKDFTLGVLTPGHLPMTPKIDKVFGKNVVFVNAALSSTGKFNRIVIHGAQSRTLVRCIPFLARYVMQYATEQTHYHSVPSRTPRTAHNLLSPECFLSSPDELVPIYVKAQRSQDLPIGTTLVKTIEDAIPANSGYPASNIFYMITDIGDYSVNAPAGTQDVSGTGAFAFEKLLDFLQERKFQGTVVFPWHIPNQASYAQAIDALNAAAKPTTIRLADGTTQTRVMKLHLGYFAHPHLASDQFWFVLHVNSEPSTDRERSEIRLVDEVGAHFARLQHMARCTHNLSAQQFVINTGVNPKIRFSGLYNAAAYCAAVAVNNEGKSETRKQQRAAMASSETSATTKLFRERVAARQAGTSSTSSSGAGPHPGSAPDVPPHSYPTSPPTGPSSTPVTPSFSPPSGLSASDFHMFETDHKRRRASLELPHPDDNNNMDDGGAGLG